MLYTELTSSAQKEALERFKAKGFPTNKWEEWKYASLKSWNEKDLDWAPAALNENLSASLQTQNGNTSFKGTLPAGVEFISFDAFMAANPAIAAKWEQRLPILDQNSLYDLNTALAVNTQVLWVKEGVSVDQAITHDFILYAANASAVQSRLIVYVEENASLTLIERAFTKEGSAEVLSNFVQEIYVNEKANLTYVKEQDLAQNTTHIDHTFITQLSNSQVDLFTFSLNAAYLRNNLHFYSDGENVVSNLNGLYVPGEDQLMDSHTVVDHRKPNSESNELYKGVLLGNATGVFNGKIFVRPDAQKTNAFQSCKNVLASTRATMNTKPQLEIWADDVKCSHGTTTGQLNEEALFYLRSRGISLANARTLLLLAFVQEVIDRVEHEETKLRLTDKIISKIQTSLAI
ncbi:MAG: Fe-S cluster assembly protein SufD [Cytophagales bacterium]|nr:Fe-S cluster assembly protein SufD [Cytophagales bacterium]